jgi:hypothetical protein
MSIASPPLRPDLRRNRKTGPDHLHTSKYKNGWAACQDLFLSDRGSQQVYYKQPMAESTTNALIEQLKAELRSELARKGGHARAEAMSAERRSQIARKAVKARWRKYRQTRKG